MPTLRAHKIASVAYRLDLDKRRVEYEEDLRSRVGEVVVVRVLGEKRVYNDLELENGRMSRLARGQIIVGALGRRRAPQGFVGDVPASLRVGDTLHLLNMGGVIGATEFVHKDLGESMPVEVLGAVCVDGRRVAVSDGALPAVDDLAGLDIPPIVMVSGTCMNSGKTFACGQLIQQFTRKGMTVHGGKLSGVACRRDLVAMEDRGALKTASFLEAGHPSTAGLAPEVMRASARTVVANLAHGSPDMIVLELGDGVIGDYGVMTVLEDEQMKASSRVHLFCAGDIVGAWGGHRFLSEHSFPPDVVSGPATDTPVGVELIGEYLGLPAVNARLRPEELAERVSEVLSASREEAGT